MNEHNAPQYNHYNMSETVSDAPATLIVGGGLAGLAAAVKIKETYPGTSVTIIEKPHPESNTQIAGQRFRSGIAGIRIDSVAEISELLARRNGDILTPEMEQFAITAQTELADWQARPGFVASNDRTEWFGPQWGIGSGIDGNQGRGRSVIEWFKATAKNAGVDFIHANAEQISQEDGHITGLQIRTRHGVPYMLHAGNYVLANGGAGGSLYASTNKAIHDSGHELAFSAGLPLIGSTTHMLHPFSNCDASGKPRLGCFETDRIAGATVYLDALSANPIKDQETTDLLAEHQAHYHFQEISARFRKFGSVILLQMPDSEEKVYARVSHHYAQLGVETNDGVTVRGTDNLFAVGDVSNLGHWTNHKERFPGFALLKCLTDGSFMVDALARNFSPDSLRVSRPDKVANKVRLSAVERQQEKTLRELNSHFLTLWLAADQMNVRSRRHIAQAWSESLEVLPVQSSIQRLSQAVAGAHMKVSETSIVEPLPISIKDVAVKLREIM
jgi:succinate dehydrogenase/fumarate reductase flavoprotein subunit